MTADGFTGSYMDQTCEVMEHMEYSVDYISFLHSNRTNTDAISTSKQTSLPQNPHSGFANIIWKGILILEHHNSGSEPMFEKFWAFL